MNTIAIIRNCAMKSSRRILIGSRNSSSFGSPNAKCHHTLINPAINNSPKPHLNPDRFNHHPFRILEFPRGMGGSQKFFRLPFSSLGHFRANSRSFGLTTTNRYVVAFTVRNFSTFVENRVSDNNFERIYIQGGVNVKPLVVERVDKEVSGAEDDATTENSSGCVSVTLVEETISDDTDVEKEAWKLLQGAVVTYCGNPVGTVAANDPGDKVPLNYDQVFIRDFVPSALAFLLRGESEVVKNFLLHTLQLQVI